MRAFCGDHQGDVDRRARARWNGPAARAGLFVGDIVTAWNAKPLDRVREIMGLLGPDSIGATVDLELVRAGASTSLKVVIGERPLV